MQKLCMTGRIRMGIQESRGWPHTTDTPFEVLLCTARKSEDSSATTAEEPIGQGTALLSQKRLHVPNCRRSSAAYRKDCVRRTKCRQQHFRLPGPDTMPRSAQVFC